LTEVWTRVATEDSINTPGFYLVLNPWGALAGWMAYAGRSLALFVGVMTVAVTYRLAREIKCS
jgi:hypothetical protein